MTEILNVIRPASGFSRRTLMIAAGTALAASLVPGIAMAQAGVWSHTEEAVTLLEGREPIAQGVVLDIPTLSENGAVVPLGIVVDRPMAEDEYVAAIHVYAPANPYPHIASFHYPVAQNVPRIETRIRLNESQTVFVLAELNTGAVLVGQSDVRITVSGCLTQADTYDSANVLQTRVRVEPGDAVSVLTLINHPMESGLRTDANGDIIPKWLVERLEARYDGEVVFVADFNRSISSNPYLRFFIDPDASGTLDLVWTEDTGETAEYSGEIAV